MKDTGLIALVIAIGLGVVGLSVFALHDTSVLVAPPDAVAESFVRELGTARYELARHYLRPALAKQFGASALKSTFEPLRVHTGKPDQVVTQEPIVTGGSARVLTTLQGRRGTASMYVDLVREHGLWRIASWPLEIVALHRMMG